MLIGALINAFADVSDACDDTWSLDGQHCYKLMTDEVNANTASQTCEDVDAVLTLIDSDEEERFLRNMLLVSYVYSSLNSFLV